MIDKGANPFVVAYDGTNRFDNSKLDHLSNLPTKKSVFLTTRPISNEFVQKYNFPDPWFYRTEVFDGKFDSFIGQGASGTVLKGEWYGKKAAFKFVEIGTQHFQKYTPDAIKSLDEKLSEMISISASVGSKVVSFYGHYR